MMTFLGMMGAWGDKQVVAGTPMRLGQLGPYVWVYALLHLLTWLAFLAVLVGVARWVWKKGDKVK